MRNRLFCGVLALGLVAAPYGDLWAEDRNEYLDMGLAQLLDVVVTTVAKSEQSLASTPAAVFVITQEDIRRSGATVVPELLAMAPGIQAAQITGSKWSVSSRGFSGYSSNKLLVLIDGRSVYSPAYNGVYWDAQRVLLEDIERIEVVRGPGGALWGANAVNGVINIITKKAQDTQGGLVRTSMGDQDSFSAATRYGVRLGESTWGRAYAAHEIRAANIVRGSGADAQDDWRDVYGGFRFDGMPAANREWTLQGDAYKGSANQMLEPHWLPQSPYMTTKVDDIDLTGWNLLGRYRTGLGNQRVLTVQGYYDHYERSDSYSGLQYDTLDLDLQYETPLGNRHQLTMGAGYRMVRGDFDPTFHVVFPDSTKNLWSAFLQDEITLLDDALWLTLGAKFEHNEYTQGEWQPSARLLWRPADNHSLWFSVARAVRTPSLTEREGLVLFGVAPDPGTGSPYKVGLVGNPEYESEEMVSYEAGYRWQVTGTLSFDLALFHSEYEEILLIGPSSPLRAQQLSALGGMPWGMLLQLENRFSGSGQGVELAADWQPASWLSFKLAYSYLEVDLSGNVGGVVQEDLVRNNTSPKHQVSLRSSMQLAEDWRLNLWARYTDATKGISNLTASNPEPMEIAPAVTLDANLVWTPTDRLEVMLAGRNLTNRSRFEYLSEYAIPPTEIERSVYGKITWRF
ncbi:MAG: TonB-dependent receptor plug domain-containing protein [Desulfobulbus sp.]|jgi:iron complex outermembrane receptor protein